jgi:predicted MPP superfamily phosphohydrolase
LTNSKIQKNEKVRIVHISDFHCDPKPRLEEQLPSIIAAAKPDVILFTGDAINSREGLPVFRKCLTRLAEIAPTFVVRGNWDTGYFADANLFGGTGVTEIDGEPVQLKIKDNVICVAGLAAPGPKSEFAAKRKSVQDVMHDVAENIFRVFMYHYPDFIEEMEKNKIDLYLAGHTHGGQIALPFYGALATLSTRGKQFEAGLYQRGRTHLFVSRGIGMEGGIAPRVRFCARPEVTVIDIVGQPRN